jgi:type I restriction enzyme, S subunit
VSSPQTTYYRHCGSVIDREYLAYFFASHQFYAQLADVKSQTTRDYVPISDQYRLFILLPPHAEQLQIAEELDVRFVNP